MNIFFLDRDPHACAQAHYNKHVVKMIVEYSQLLSTAHRELDGYVGDECYKTTHKNHPSAIWVRESKIHYEWLYMLLVELADEYSYRYNRVHASTRLFDFLQHPPKNIPINCWIDPPQCMPAHSQREDSISGYRNYYMTEKKRMAAWIGRLPPEWFCFNVQMETDYEGM